MTRNQECEPYKGENVKRFDRTITSEQLTFSFFFFPFRSSGFTEGITTLTSASTTTSTSTVHITSARCRMSGPSATCFTWWTMTATAHVTTPPKASSAGNATGLCLQTDRSSFPKSSSSSHLSHWVLSSAPAESTTTSVSMAMTVLIRIADRNHTKQWLYFIRSAFTML